MTAVGLAATAILLAGCGKDTGPASGSECVHHGDLKAGSTQAPAMTDGEAGLQYPMPPGAPIEALDQEQMAELQALTGVDFDRKWLDTFRDHHMAAVMMADVALSGASGGDAASVEQKIHDGRLEQPETMDSLRQQLG